MINYELSASRGGRFRKLVYLKVFGLSGNEAVIIVNE